MHGICNWPAVLSVMRPDVIQNESFIPHAISRLKQNEIYLPQAGRGVTMKEARQYLHKVMKAELLIRFPCVWIAVQEADIKFVKGAGSKSD